MQISVQGQVRAIYRLSHRWRTLFHHWDIQDRRHIYWNLVSAHLVDNGHCNHSHHRRSRSAQCTTVHRHRNLNNATPIARDHGRRLRLSTWFTDTFVFLRIFVDDTIRIGVTVVVFVALFWLTNRSIDSVHLMFMVVNQLPTFFAQTASLTRLWVLDASGELWANFRRTCFHCREIRRSNR